MSPLVSVFLSPSVSELPDADRNPFTNPSGLHHCKSKSLSQKNGENIGGIRLSWWNLRRGKKKDQIVNQLTNLTDFDYLVLYLCVKWLYLFSLCHDREGKYLPLPIERALSLCLLVKWRTIIVRTYTTNHPLWRAQSRLHLCHYPFGHSLWSTIRKGIPLMR